MGLLGGLIHKHLLSGENGMKTLSLARAISNNAKAHGLKALAVLFLGVAVAACDSGPTSPAKTPPAATAPAATAPAVAAALPAKVYFDVGSAALGVDAGAIIIKTADAIKAGNLQVAITGYTDKTGDAAKNEELAKNRAMVVRDALKAAGVAEAHIAMKPPLFVEVGAGGNDAEARRVEINKQ